MASVSRYLRQNILGLVAIFLALNAGAYAITVTDLEPDYKAPWNSGGIQRGVGAGFLISGGRIMTGTGTW